MASNPRRPRHFIFTQRMSPHVVWILGVVFLINFYLIFIWSPPEAQMGNLVRILYFHVASAWIAFIAIFVTALFAILYLVFRKLYCDFISHASAEIGVLFTTLTLVVGSLWARPIWNTWWTWDPRLTTTLILWFLFVGYLLLRGTIDGIERRARIAAIYAIIASVDVPIIQQSVTWWRSIHPTVIDDTGFHMPASMTFTLMFSFMTFTLLYLLLLQLRVRQIKQNVALIQLRMNVRQIQSGTGKGQ